jgi:hypothetical protein
MSLRLGKLAFVAALVLVPFALAANANATLVTVTFDDDLGFPAETDVVTVVDPGHEIEAGDFTNIGSVILLDSEFIDIGPLLGSFSSGFSIVYHIAGGGDPYPGNSDFQTPGFGPNASLSFTGLDSPITAVNLILFDVIGLTTGDVSFTGNSASIPLGNVGVDALLNFGTIRVDFEVPGTTPTPEPSALALLALGLVAAGARRARR